MRKLLRVALFAALSSACSEERSPVACAAYAAAGLGVSVADAATGQPICDASVSATEGGYSEKLTSISCTYTGAYERAGTYVVRAAREGYAPVEQGPVRVVMGGGQCPHVVEARITLQLAPLAQR
jgi:hypothetical protein